MAPGRSWLACSRDRLLFAKPRKKLPTAEKNAEAQVSVTDLDAAEKCFQTEIQMRSNRTSYLLYPVSGHLGFNYHPCTNNAVNMKTEAFGCSMTPHTRVMLSPVQVPLPFDEQGYDIK